MSRGLAYDSDEGRNYAAALTAIMHGEAYKQSAIVARDHGGPFVKYDENREPFLRVIAKHRDAAYRDPDQRRPEGHAPQRDRASSTRRSSSASSTATATPRSPSWPRPARSRS